MWPVTLLEKTTEVRSKELVYIPIIPVQSSKATLAPILRHHMLRFLQKYISVMLQYCFLKKFHGAHHLAFSPQEQIYLVHRNGATIFFTIPHKKVPFPKGRSKS